eukprot:TRINITY_DN12883_c0_g1_i2.p2 TRINITY_DN12883_c0_g1~~TRINITY_DN12883_c0_g1_i2.p2  ORF type:complete len:202 (+),score=78.13 TRINITY_DN12883_c0_g1_i2:438-1043(+)
MNLDGETNLKRRTALPDTRRSTQHAVCAVQAVLCCEAPSKVMHSFNGNLSVGGGPAKALTVDNLLMRGAKLMNTEWAIGVVVYTGDESRIMMNAGAAPSKMSKVERITNKLLVGVVLLQAVLCFTQALRAALWHQSHDSGSWYLALDSSAVEDGVKRYFTYMILLTQLIPISLYVTVEIVKFLQMFLMQTDLHMYLSLIHI